MPKSSIIVDGISEMDLATRQNAIEEVNKLPTDQLRRVLKLVKSEKAKTYLSSDLKFAILQKFL